MGGQSAADLRVTGRRFPRNLQPVGAERLGQDLAGLGVVGDRRVPELGRLAGRVRRLLADAIDLPDAALVLLAVPRRLLAADPAEIRILVGPVVHARAAQVEAGFHPNDLPVEQHIDELIRLGYVSQNGNRVSYHLA